MRVLAVNAGSSSLKLRLLGSDDRRLAGADLPARDGAFDADRVAGALGDLSEVDAVGHRVVHGGPEFQAPVVLDATVAGRLRALADLAPLHQPKSLAGIEAVSRVLPDVPAVACFDTAFHARLPAAAATYAVPAEWRDGYGLRRYGFHGLSHAYAVSRAEAMLGRDPGRLVVCHLGAGASLAAVRAGRSVDTTMGFTPLEGLVMATRAGTVDPGMMLWLQEHVGIPTRELADALERRSGLTALGGTPDMRVVLDRAEAGDEPARLALDVYLHRLRQGIAAMAATLGGLDTLVFTGGVGENAARIRADAAAGLAFLGVDLDATRNDALAHAAEPDADVSAAGVRVRVLVIAAREDLQIAAEVRRVLGAASAPDG